MTNAFSGADNVVDLAIEREFSRSASLTRHISSGVLLAVSGGADSTAMLRCFVAFVQSQSVPASIHIAHVNHCLRGNESDDDAQFVSQLAAQFGLPYHETQLTQDMFAADDSGSVEAAARTLRYDFLQQTAEHNSLRHVAVAHNADDQAETILHRIIRGTGLAGLAGIPPVRPLGEAVTLIRPMLTFSRRRILAYLDAIQQPFRTDSTNAEMQYTRNKIRNDLLPSLVSGYNHAVVDALLRLGTQAAEWSQHIKSQTDALYGRAVTHHANHVAVQIETFADVPPYMVRELFVMIWSRQGWHLRDMTFSHWQQLAEMSLTQTPSPCKQVFPGAVMAERANGQLILQPPL